MDRMLLESASQSSRCLQLIWPANAPAKANCLHSGTTRVVTNGALVACRCQAWLLVLCYCRPGIGHSVFCDTLQTSFVKQPTNMHLLYSLQLPLSVSDTQSPNAVYLLLDNSSPSCYSQFKRNSTNPQKVTSHHPCIQ